MAREKIAAQVAVVFVIALALYGVTFYGIERARQAKGPWHVTFRSDAEGRPSVRMSQPALNISNVTVWFPEARIERTNFSKTVVFDMPITNVPFGRVLFLDTTFLPGTLTLDLFGHEIELLPRTLVVNRKEVPWKSKLELELRGRRPI